MISTGWYLESIGFLNKVIFCQSPIISSLQRKTAIEMVSVTKILERIIRRKKLKENDIMEKEKY